MLQVSTSDSHEVTLVNVTKESTGIYKCEISEDYPSYHTAILAGRMEVAGKPKFDILWQIILYKLASLKSVDVQVKLNEKSVTYKSLNR